MNDSGRRLSNLQMKYRYKHVSIVVQNIFRYDIVNPSDPHVFIL